MVLLICGFLNRYLNTQKHKMFTERFIRVPIELYNKTQAELTGDDGDSFEGYLKINPMEILSYRPRYNDDDHNEENVTVVDFKNGENILVLMPLIEFEKLLNDKYK